MTDVALVYIPGPAGQLGQFDLQLGNGDLKGGDALATSVYLSLFTDRRAEDDDTLPDGSNNRRGWWADPAFGSRLWLLTREKQIPQTLNRARQYAEQALQWLLDDGIAATITVTTEWVRMGFLGISVVITKPDGLIAQYSYTWDQVRNAIP
jgi:phage gp46-like protein